MQLLVAREDDVGWENLPEGCGDLGFCHSAIVTRSRG
jgi:hypothetical protein